MVKIKIIDWSLARLATSLVDRAFWKLGQLLASGPGGLWNIQKKKNRGNITFPPFFTSLSNWVLYRGDQNVPNVLVPYIKYLTYLTPSVALLV